MLQVDLSDLQIEGWLADGFVLGMQKSSSLVLTFGPETLLFAGDGVLTVEGPVRSAIQDKTAASYITFLLR